MYVAVVGVVFFFLNAVVFVILGRRVDRHFSDNFGKRRGVGMVGRGGGQGTIFFVGGDKLFAAEIMGRTVSASCMRVLLRTTLIVWQLWGLFLVVSVL